MEAAFAEFERLAARAEAHAAEGEAIDAEFNAIIDRLMAGGPGERQMARLMLAGWAEGTSGDIADRQHLREAMQNRIGDGLI